MSSLNKVGSFVHSRTRSNWLGSQHQASSSGTSEPPIQRQGLAAGNARALVPVTALPTAPSTSRPRQDHAETTTPYNEPPDTNHHGLQKDELDQHPNVRDAFDTEVEDLTESLLSEEAQADADRENVPPKGGHDRGAPSTTPHTRRSHSGHRRPGISSSIDNNPPISKQSGIINGQGFNDIIDPRDLEDDGSESDDPQPGDDPTVTFTPEQTAQVQDTARRQLPRQGEQPKDSGSSKPAFRSSKTAPFKDLYDVSGPSPLPRPDGHGHAQWLPRSNGEPALARRSTSGDALLGEAGVLQPMSPRPHATAPFADHVPTQQRHNNEEASGLFEPSDAMEEDEEDNDDIDRRSSREQDASQPQPAKKESITKLDQGTNFPKPASASPLPPQPSSKEDEEGQQDDELDYPPSTLLSMPYKTLQSQPYDHVPHTSSSTTSPTNPSPSTPVESPPPPPLPTRLHQILPLPPSDQRQFFNSLSIEEWEDSGDWFIEQFGNMMQRMKEARWNKRRVTSVFEEEVAKQSETVQRITGGYEDVMQGMKKGGMGLLGR